MGSTYNRVIDYLAKPVIRDADIRFNEEVVRVENLESDTDGVVVETSAGFSGTFDHVVMTTPHGWLQKQKEVFRPPIPRELSEAIDSIHYGNLEKLYVHFSTAYWDQDTSDGDGFNQPGKFATESLWTTPKYAHDTNPKRFNMEAFSFSTMPVGVAHATLCFFLYGDFSRMATEAIQGLKPHSEAYNDALRPLLEPYYSLLPNYEEKSDDCQPTGFLLTDWEHDRLAGNGSYTNFQIGLKDGRESLDRIRAGMGMDRRIWFAGEHTAPFKAMGTIVGAYWGGERVGKKIASLHGLCEVPEYDPVTAEGALGPGDNPNLDHQLDL